MQKYIDKDLGMSDWFEITQSYVNLFADTTLDHQFIHTEPEQAKTTPLGGTIAHGFLLVSLFPHLLSQGMQLDVTEATIGLNYGFNRLRFITPVRVGSRVRLRGKVVDVIEKKPKRFLFTLAIEMDIEGEKSPALIADWLNMFIAA